MKKSDTIRSAIKHLGWIFSHHIIMNIIIPVHLCWHRFKISKQDRCITTHGKVSGAISVISKRKTPFTVQYLLIKTFNIHYLKYQPCSTSLLHHQYIKFHFVWSLRAAAMWSIKIIHVPTICYATNHFHIDNDIENQRQSQLSSNK